MKWRERFGDPNRGQPLTGNEQGRAGFRRGWPVLSVDSKKKELVGDFKNAGREWQSVGCPEPVRVHDFVDPRLGKAIPYGVYDVVRNRG